jgi:hypothetical protein
MSISNVDEVLFLSALRPALAMRRRSMREM